MKLTRKERRDLWKNSWLEFNNSNKGKIWLFKRWWKSYRFANNMVHYVEYVWLPDNTKKYTEIIKKVDKYEQ